MLENKPNTQPTKVAQPNISCRTKVSGWGKRGLLATARACWRLAKAIDVLGNRLLRASFRVPRAPAALSNGAGGHPTRKNSLNTNQPAISWLPPVIDPANPAKWPFPRPFAVGLTDKPISYLLKSLRFLPLPGYPLGVPPDMPAHFCCHGHENGSILRGFPEPRDADRCAHDTERERSG